jgi:hypothetical protein
MRFRPLALFALTACLAVLVGDYTPADAQLPRQDKKNKKGKFAPKSTTPPPAAEPTRTIELPKPLPTVVPAPTSKDPATLASLIDAEVARKLDEAKIPASARCSDEEFLRRAYLDITGVIPTAEKAKAFLDDKSPDKRAKLLDELLADANYGRRMADIWTAKLFPADSTNRLVLKEPFYKWFEEEFNKNTPWDQVVTNLVTATGDAADNPAATYFLANRSIDKLTDTVGQHFLGIQLQCAQCHNHPFTSWKQSEYWGMAAFFSRRCGWTTPRSRRTARPPRWASPKAPSRRGRRTSCPSRPRTWRRSSSAASSRASARREPYRPVLAQWMTAPENPFFARAFVNRTWAHLFGRGIVHPVDDMMPENEPSHPELLDALARHIAGVGEFDQKYLIKAICLSEAYQRTSKPTPENKADVKLFSRMTDEGDVARAALRLAGAGDRAGPRGGAGQEGEGAARRAGRCPQPVRQLLPGRGRGGQPRRVRGRHPAGAAADELADRQQPGGGAGHHRHRPPARGRHRAHLPGHPLPPADRRRDDDAHRVRGPGRQPADRLQRHPLGRAEWERVYFGALNPKPTRCNVWA